MAMAGLFVPLRRRNVCGATVAFSCERACRVAGPGSENPWAQALCGFARTLLRMQSLRFDPDYMQLPGEDAIGFRCLAQRSRLADTVKDGGVVSMFPPLADEWW